MMALTKNGFQTNLDLSGWLATSTVGYSIYTRKENCALTWAKLWLRQKRKSKQKIFGLIGDLVSVEASFALKQFVEGLG